MKNFKLIQSININAASSCVWNTLTDKQMIKQYLFGVDTVTDWRKGSPVIMRGIYNELTFALKGKVIQVERGKLLKFTYFNSLEGYADLPENYSLVTYTLESQGTYKTKSTYEREQIPTVLEYQNAAKYFPMILEQIKMLAEQ
ncbi:MAG TPA: SRPBCC domain-containing protein [Cytophagales bacterium]|nr:SRPBCC domain-containing protein [Cytophagales bacterium]